jgi:hypothetical protein
MIWEGGKEIKGLNRKNEDHDGIIEAGKENRALQYEIEILGEKAVVTIVFTLRYRKLCAIMISWKKHEIIGEVNSLLNKNIGPCTKQMLAGNKKLYWWISGNQFMLLKDEPPKITLIYGDKPHREDQAVVEKSPMARTIEPFRLWNFGMNIAETLRFARKHHIQLEELRLPFLLQCVEDWVHDQRSPLLRSFLEGPLTPSNN